jgi:hypothetical protein
MSLPLGVKFPAGVNLAPRSELCPLGELFIHSFIPRGEHTLMFRRTKGQKEGFHPWKIDNEYVDKKK